MPAGLVARRSVVERSGLPDGATDRPSLARRSGRRARRRAMTGLSRWANGDLGGMRLLRIPGVFQPHNDSWMLAATLREHPPDAGDDVLDLCTGSGMLAVQAALLGARVTAVDISRRALLSAHLNAWLNGVRVRTRRGSLFSGLEGERFDTIVSNPPYVPKPGDDELPERGPQRAWDAGADGRALLDPLCEQVARHLRPGGSVFIVHSSVCGVDRTIEQLEHEGLETEVVARWREPLGPRMRERVDELWACGVLAHGAMEEEVVIIRGGRPAVVAEVAA
jgi:release factor glutamine methyltransferase